MIRRIIGYLMALPQLLVLMVKLCWAFVEFKLKKRKSKGHFKKGLAESGVGKAEAQEIMRECFNG